MDKHLIRLPNRCTTTCEIIICSCTNSSVEKGEISFSQLAALPGIFGKGMKYENRHRIVVTPEDRIFRLKCRLHFSHILKL